MLCMPIFHVFHRLNWQMPFSFFALIVGSFGRSCILALSQMDNQNCVHYPSTDKETLQFPILQSFIAELGICTNLSQNDRQKFLWQSKLRLARETSRQVSSTF